MDSPTTFSYHRSFASDGSVLTHENLFSSLLFFNDKEETKEERHERLQFHISQGTYFNSLATILCLLATCPQNTRNRILKQCVEDLNYLQENYWIKKKDGSQTYSWIKPAEGKNGLL